MDSNMVTIDISFNSLDNIKECLICLETIIDNNDVGIYLLECCNNPVHIKCLYDWYTTHKNRKNCFICNQYNSFCEDISNPIITDNSYIQIIDSGAGQNNQVFIMRNTAANLNKKFIIIFLTCLCTIFMIIMILLFSQNVF